MLDKSSKYASHAGSKMTIVSSSARKWCNTTPLCGPRVREYTIYEVLSVKWNTQTHGHSLHGDVHSPLIHSCSLNETRG